MLGCTAPAELDLGESAPPPHAKTGAPGQAGTGEPAPQPWPEPEREPIASPKGDPIVEVEQFPYLQSPPKSWTINPQGNWLAEPSGDGCDVWDIEAGLRLGRWTDPKLDPCKQWPAPERVLGYSSEPNSFDGALTAVIAKAEVEIHVGGKQARELACRGCAEVRAFAWEPRGHRLALVREGGGLEIWDADTGQRRALLSNKAALGKGEIIEKSRVAWSSLGVLVSHDVKRRNDRSRGRETGDKIVYEEDYFDWHTQIELWNDTGTSMQGFRSDDDKIMGWAYTDASRQWLLVIHDDPIASYERGESLAIYPLAGRHSSLEWVDWDRSIPDEMTEYESSGGRWRVDATTSWLADFAAATLYGEWAFGLTVLQAEPSPSLQRIELLRDDEEALDHDGVALQPFGFAAGKAVVDWSYTDANGQQVRHRASESASADCELVDVSPDLAIELLRCAAELRVRSRDQTRSFARESRWIWGRSGWLAIEHGGRLTVLDQQLAVRIEQRDSVMLDAALANTHDLLALRHEGAFELLDVRGERSLLRVEHEAIDAALSPDGKRVATLGQDKVRIFAVETGTLLARWDEPAAQQLAFAQDGRVLLTGATKPERAWNSFTGERATLATALAMLPDGTFDPTWRWLIVGPERVVRVLDGLALNLGPNWAMLDDGRFVVSGGGTPPIERTRDRSYRIGEALAIPSCSHADLQQWLQRPQLLEDFFAGRPIAPAVLPDDAARPRCAKP